MTIFSVVVGAAGAWAQTANGEVVVGTAAETMVPAFPRFRVIDPEQAVPASVNGRNIVLLTDADFAPWSFAAADGRMQGISVDLAVLACAEAGLVCSIKAMPFDKLTAALAAGDGQLIVSGLKADTINLDTVLPTKPYFLSTGRFAVRQGSSLPSNDARALAGKRIGHVRNSAHGAFLEKQYSKSTLTSYDKLTSLQEALRTGEVDAAFADGVALSFWLAGNSARNCCQALGGAFVDHATISRGLFFALSSNETDLREALDAALDVLEDKGETARVFMNYLPGSVW